MKSTSFQKGQCEPQKNEDARVCEDEKRQTKKERVKKKIGQLKLYDHDQPLRFTNNNPISTSIYLYYVHIHNFRFLMTLSLSRFWTFISFSFRICFFFFCLSFSFGFVRGVYKALDNKTEANVYR